MTNAGNIGIGSADFINYPFTDWGVALTWEEATKTTDNVDGSETLSYAGGVATTAIFIKRSQRYVQTHEGLVDLGDATMFFNAGTTSSINFYPIGKDDRITYNGEKFIVLDVILDGS